MISSPAMQWNHSVKPGPRLHMTGQLWYDKTSKNRSRLLFTTAADTTLKHWFKGWQLQQRLSLPWNLTFVSRVLVSLLSYASSSISWLWLTARMLQSIQRNSARSAMSWFHYILPWHSQSHSWYKNFFMSLSLSTTSFNQLSIRCTTFFWSPQWLNSCLYFQWPLI